MYVQDEGRCLALGLPMISFYARPHSTIGADVFFAGGNGGRASGAWWDVACSVGRGSFDPLSLGGRRRVLTAPLQLGWQASFPGLCLDGYRGALVFPEPAKGKTKFGARVEDGPGPGFVWRGESNRIGSGWIRQDRRDPFLTLYPCDLIGSRRRLLGDFVTGYFNGTR